MPSSARRVTVITERVLDATLSAADIGSGAVTPVKTDRRWVIGSGTFAGMAAAGSYVVFPTAFNTIPAIQLTPGPDMNEGSMTARILRKATGSFSGQTVGTKSANWFVFGSV